MEISKKIVRVFIWVVILFYSILFLNINLLSFKLLFAFLTFILIILQTILSKKSYANKFWEFIGTGILSGLVVSLFRDVASNSLTPIIIIMYILGFFTSIFLVMISLLGEQPFKSPHP